MTWMKRTRLTKTQKHRTIVRIRSIGTVWAPPMTNGGQR